MKNWLKTSALMLFLLPLAVQSASAIAEDQAPVMPLRFLSPDLANQAVTAAVADCTKRGYKVAVAVVDRAGNLAAFLRDPLSGPHTIKVAQGKAFTAATLQAVTSQVTNRPDLRFAPGILLMIGGVPISAGGHFYGGIGVAGADPEIDEVCGMTGVNAITETLEFAD
jgi:uncharacterized protein GlcG (DUF336 family)